MSRAQEPAFPGVGAGGWGAGGGMTYREWLIGQALAGNVGLSSVPRLAARHAVEAADAVLAILDGEKKAP